MKNFLPILPVLLLLSLVSCGGAAPEIEGISWELFWIRSPGEDVITEELALFVRADDEDGREDLANMYLVHPEYRLYWPLSVDEWEERSREGRLWIGSSRFSGAAELPRGEYRILLVDRAGEQAEDTIYIDLPALPGELGEEEFPSLELQKGDFLVGSSIEGPYIVLGEDSNSEVAVYFETEQKRCNPGQYTDAGAVDSLSWYVFVLHPREGIYLGGGPYRF